MTNRDRQHDNAELKTNHHLLDDDDLAPGRRTLTQGLRGPGATYDSGLAAVATAQSSAGDSLPEPTLRKFESSLDTDLSSVRIHTSTDSATAAHAVGALAYTVGQDIHFGAGQYDPTSVAGERLLAHEVAHTVQQRGGTEVRQNKLAISTAQDAAEAEADRAADAMLAGRAASVTPGATMISRWEAPVIADEDNPGIYDRVSDGNDGFQKPYEDVQVDDKSVTWKEKTKGADGSVTEIEKAGLNMYSSEARSQGIVPDPADPYGTPPDQVAGYDWSGLQGSAPESPPDFGISLAPKQPLPVTHKGNPNSTYDSSKKPAKLALQPSQLAFAQSRVTMFKGAFDTGKGSWDAMTPNVKAFYEAGKSPELKEGGLNLIQSQAQAKADANKNMSQLVGGQKVGLKKDGSATTTVGDIKKMDDKQVSDLESNLPEDKKAKLQALAGDVSSKNNAVKTAFDAHKLTIDQHKLDSDKAKTAAKNLDLTKLKNDTADEKKKLADAQAAKKEAEGAVENVAKGFDWAMKLYAKPAETIVEGSKEALKQLDIALYKQIVSADYDKQILTSTAAVTAATGKIKKASSEISTAELDQANQQIVLAAQAMTNAKRDILDKLNQADIAYRAFADQAAQQVGGKKGDMVRAAIEALPKVALVVRYCDAVVSAISVPSFNTDVGLGLLGAASSTDAFVARMGMLNAYKAGFEKEKGTWQELYDKLQKVAQSYGLGD
jgi:uncharacterized protein DUF4157